MPDKRESILRSNLPKDYIWEEMRVVDNAPFDMIFNAMDEHGKQMSLEFLDFVIKNMQGHSIDRAGKVEIKYKGEWLTKKQLFENFL